MLRRAAGRQPSEKGQRNKASEGLRPAARPDENSFIPRLWAKKHIDHLLREALTPQIKQQVIALSQEFHLISPFTSLLVLETDADRKRFGVKRSMQMRDGEQFFADGRKEAEYSFRQQQQQLEVAKLWRQQLHEQMRNQIRRFGRDEFAAAQTQLAAQEQGGSFYVSLDRGESHRLRTLNEVTQSLIILADGRARYELGTEWTDMNFTVPKYSVPILNKLPYTGAAFSDEFGDAVNAPEFLGNKSREQLFDDPVGLNVVSEVDDFERFGRSVGDQHHWMFNGRFDFSSNHGLGDLDLGNDFGTQIDLAGGTNSFFLRQNNAASLRSPTRADKIQPVYPSQPMSASQILVEPPTFGLRGVLPESPAAVDDRVHWPAEIQKLVPAIVHRRGAKTAPIAVRFTRDWPADVVELMKSMSSQLDMIPGGLVVKHVERSVHPTRGRAVGVQPSVQSSEASSNEPNQQRNSEGLRPAL